MENKLNQLDIAQLNSQEVREIQEFEEKLNKGRQEPIYLIAVKQPDDDTLV